MGCDMVVALPVATGCDQTLFGANLHQTAGTMAAVRRAPGRIFSPGESLRTQFLQLLQVRQTCTVIGVQSPENGGYLCGVNENGVVVSCSQWQSRCQCPVPGLLGPELVRLALERSHSASQALEVLTGLISRYGQGSYAGRSSGEQEDDDHIFILADANEAFVVEAAGQAWATQEIHQVRAASDVAIIRQDWYSLAPGLADKGKSEGWWKSDGSKLDFVGSLSEAPTGKASALRRWGRATLILEQQNGHLDAACLRRLLADHYEGTPYEVDPLQVQGSDRVTPLCQHGRRGASMRTTVSAVAQLPTDAEVPLVLWLAFGPPCIGLYFPLLIEGELPPAFSGEPADLWTRGQQLTAHLGTDSRRWQRVRQSLGRLQSRFDHDIEEFLGEATALKKRGRQQEVCRMAGSLMQSHVERYEENLQSLLGERRESRVLETADVAGLADF